MKSNSKNIFDRLIKGFIRIIIPNKIISEIVFINLIKYKLEALFILGSIILTGIFFLIPNEVQASVEDPTNYQINNYLEDSMLKTNTPLQSPFGGKGLENVKITAKYHDINYYKIFGEWHTGLDIVPSILYYKTNKAYKVSGQIIIFATCNGMAKGLVDSYGANYIYLKCTGTTINVLFVHNKINFIKNETFVHTGQPIAIMGSTGKATGPHLHYEIREINNFGKYITLDPLNFIK